MLKTYFPALTGVRAVAAYMIFLLHMASLEAPDTLPWLKMLAVRYMQQFHVGVAIFFVLSGFLITARYVDRVEPTGRWFRHYLQNRFARIYPVYFILSVGTFALMAVQPTGGWWEWPAAFTAKEKWAAVGLNATLLRAYFKQFAVLGLPTAWSLTVEETFYWCAPALLLGLRQDRRRLLVYPLALLALGALLVAFCSRFVPYYGLMHDMKFMLAITFFGHSPEFFMGMGLALWASKQPPRLTTSGAYTWAGALGIAGYMLVLAVVCRFYSFPPAGGATGTDWSYGITLAHNVLLPALVCSLLWGLLSERTPLRWLLETKLFGLLGRASYVLYLMHLGTFDQWFRVHVSNSNRICFLAYTVISILLYQLVERPLHQLFKAKPWAAT